MSDIIRVLIADDEAIIRAGLRMLVNSQPDLNVVAEAVDGEAAVRLARDTEPDVVLMDIRMPTLDGIAATRRITVLGPKVIVLTTYDLDENLYLAMRAGASGFMLKTSAPEDLLHGIRVVARGDALLEPLIVRRLLDEYTRKPPPPALRPTNLKMLSARETDVLRLISRGLSNTEIAEQLHVSEGTTKSHVGSILTKLGVRDRLQAVIHAYETGFVQPGDNPT